MTNFLEYIYIYIYIFDGENKKIFGCVIASVSGKNITAKLGILTLSKAISQHPWVLKNGIILHSDGGSQYTSRKYTDYYSSHSVTQIMSRAGCPYDNAPMSVTDCSLATFC